MKKISPLPFVAKPDRSAAASMALADAQMIALRPRERRQSTFKRPAARAQQHFTAVSEILEQAKRGE